MKQCHHFLDIVWHDQRVRFARRLEDIVARRCDPVMLEVAPLAAQRKSMDRSAVAMAR
jgi:hypothetical protein